jgi:hypothetical protein
MVYALRGPVSTNRLHIYSLHSPTYIEDIVVPNVEAGAAIADRSLEDMTLSTQVLAIPGTGEEREAAREAVREHTGFYGSTRTYRRIFEIHGWGDVVDTFHVLTTEGRWGELADYVTDEMVDTFSIEGY